MLSTNRKSRDKKTMRPYCVSRFFHFHRKIRYCSLFPNEVNHYGFFQGLKFSSTVNTDLNGKLNGNNLRSFLSTIRKKSVYFADTFLSRAGLIFFA